MIGISNQYPSLGSDESKAYQDNEITRNLGRRHGMAGDPGFVRIIYSLLTLHRLSLGMTIEPRQFGESALSQLLSRLDIIWDYRVSD